MYSRRSILFASIFCSLALAIFACNSPQTDRAEDLGRIVAQTQTALAVEQFLTQTSEPTNLVETESPTETSQEISITPTPSPSPSPTIQSDCTNKAKFEAETIPDDYVLAPGDAFTKSWTLRNIGTCTWTPEYSLVFEEGVQMGGTSPKRIERTVAPSGLVEVSVDLVAPDDAGQYQGFWKLSSPQGQSFGLGESSEVSFWVKIVVSLGSSLGDIELGSPSWVETFDSENTSSFYLGADSNVSFTIENGNLEMEAISASGDQWRVAERSYIDDFYLESLFRTGANCSGEDSYGLIVRAPDQPDNIIDTGYVFVFSCDGKYRVYRMDNGAYSGLINWTSHSAINRGVNQINKMGIKAQGDIFQLYANGILIAEFTDFSYDTGYFGLVIRAKNTPNFQVWVSDISYWDS